MLIRIAVGFVGNIIVIAIPVNWHTVPRFSYLWYSSVSRILLINKCNYKRTERRQLTRSAMPERVWRIARISTSSSVGNLYNDQAPRRPAPLGIMSAQLCNPPPSWKPLPLPLKPPFTSPKIRYRGVWGVPHYAERWRSLWQRFPGISGNYIHGPTNQIPGNDCEFIYLYIYILL